MELTEAARLAGAKLLEAYNSRFEDSEDAAARIFHAMATCLEGRAENRKIGQVRL